MPWHDTSCRDGLALVHQEDGRHPRSAPAARRIGRASVGGSGRMALKFLESAKWEIDLSGRVAPTSKVRKTLDTTHETTGTGGITTLALERDARCHHGPRQGPSRESAETRCLPHPIHKGCAWRGSGARATSARAVGPGCGRQAAGRSTKHRFVLRTEQRSENCREALQSRAVASTVHGLRVGGTLLESES